MLGAYRGLKVDAVPVAPEFWYYYPAKLLGVDMIEFQREVPFHEALKKTFERFACEGWGIAFAPSAMDADASQTTERYVDDSVLHSRTTCRVGAQKFHFATHYSKDEPAWVVERPIKDLGTDLVPWMDFLLGNDPAQLDFAPMQRAWVEVGESYLLEAWLGVPFFDFYAGQREGGFETALFDFINPDLRGYLVKLRERYQRRLVALVSAVARATNFESFCIGCSWSCVSLIGPELWREWDKPIITAVAEAVHEHGGLLHIHFHGKSAAVLADFPETGVDCVCPFERPPGGDVEGVDGLRAVRTALSDRVTMNGNVHTVETLIRGGPSDVRREVEEIREAFCGSNRYIIGTGDQVGRETPEENIRAMIEAGRI